MGGVSSANSNTVLNATIDSVTGRLYVDNAGSSATVNVTDGSTTVAATTIDFTSGATVTNGGGGTANVAISGGGTGTVTTVSVVPVNGFAGTVANATTTPAITLSTSITGLLKGNGTAIAAATTGTDYSAGTSALSTGILKSTTTTGALTIAVAADFPTLNQNTTGSAATLTTARTIAITGDLAYTSPSFDGSTNVTAAGTLATVNTNIGSFTNANITVNAKGLITAASNGSGGGGTPGGSTTQLQYNNAGAFGGISGATTNGTALTVASSDFILAGSSSGTTTLNAAATASGVLTLPAATDTLIGKATTDTLTNKTYDTAGTGNSLSINGVAATANTGTGAVARATGPTFTTPTLGVAAATTLNKVTITAPATGSTLTIADGKTLTASNTLTFTGTDGSSVAFGTGGTVLYGNQSITLSGDITGSGTTAITTTLATVNANVGSFGSATAAGTFTVNAKGLITAASNTTVTPAVGSITGLGTGVATFLATPSSANLATAVTDETGTGALVFATSPTLTTAVLGSSTATTQTPADNSTKVATTAYVDAAVLGQNFKEAALVATTANLVGAYLSGVFTYTATGTDAIDGVTLALSNRVLVKNQTTSFQNGIYSVTTAGAIGVAGVLTRTSDANTSGEFKTGDSIFVTSGTVNTSTTWAYTGIDSPAIGTDAITYVQAAGLGQYTSGNGITITGASVAIDTSVTVDKTTVQTLTNKTLTSPTFTAPVLGTPASGVGTNITGIPAANILAGSFGAGAYVISTSLQAATIELGNATDTTLSRVSAGVIAVEGVTVDTISAANTLTNKTLTSPILTTPALGTPASGVMTNVTGTATGLTSGITNALKSATTTVDVSAATAPSSGQVLTATSSTTATWQAAGGTTININTTKIDQTPASGTYGTLAGTVNGSNALFTVSNAAYQTGTLEVELNGQTQTQGASNDFVETTPASGTFTFNVAPPTGSKIITRYIIPSSGSGTTGSGSVVLATSPTFVTNITTPAIAAATNTSINLSSGTYNTIQTYSPTAAGTATLDLSKGNIHHITMPAGNITIALSNGTAGQCFIVRILQDGTGSRTVTWFTTIKWAGGSAPTLTTTASKADTMGFEVTTAGSAYDGYVVGQNI